MLKNIASFTTSKTWETKASTLSNKPLMFPAALAVMGKKSNIILFNSISPSVAIPAPGNGQILPPVPPQTPKEID